MNIRTAAEGRDGDNPEWLHIIWACNEIRPETFGSPEIKPWWAGGTVEEYTDARVLHRGDGSVSIISKTDAGDEVLKAAVAKLAADR